MQLALVGNEKIVAEIIASGRDLNLSMAATPSNWTALDIANGKGHWKTAELLKLAQDDPKKAVRHCKKQLNLPQAAKVLCLLILLGDGYLTGWQRTPQDFLKFIRICERLPIELQIVICNRLWNLPQAVISPREFDQAFRWFLLDCRENHSMFL
jgi:hypothetical protein